MYLGGQRGFVLKSWDKNTRRIAWFCFGVRAADDQCKGTQEKEVKLAMKSLTTLLYPLLAFVSFILL